MTIGVLCSEGQWQELTAGQSPLLFRRIATWNEQFTLDAYLLLEIPKGLDSCVIKQPVFINEVAQTLQEKKYPTNFLRINGWPGFLERNTWELAGQITDEVRSAFYAMQKKLVAVPDIPGLVTARVVAMIINEAYFALQEGVSKQEEIDLAMKLGTGYPYGPFEWGNLIGLKNIEALLTKLSGPDKRYLPAPLLKAAAHI